MRSSVRRAGSAVAIGALLLLGGEDAKAQATADFCGCAGSPEGLGSFNSNDPATWPAGTVDIAHDPCYPHVRIPLPESGVLVFDSFTVSNRHTGCGTRNVTVSFVPNAANTPVTLLIRGDLTVGSSDLLSVRGSGGSDGSSGSNGVGGLGGPGGFAGGDGAYQLSNLASNGGAGVGPGGGAGSIAEGRVRAGGGSFFGVPELRPLVGGSGGGGGHSLTSGGSCAGGGGGGGGGALLVAANGTVRIDGTVSANGGGGGNRAGGSCSSNGAGGSAGAIRILASAITGGGAIEAVGAAGGDSHSDANDRGNGGGSGRIRLEAITNSFAVNGTSPVAVRAPAPGPLANPITPTVTITGIDGKATPVNPVGHRGQIDLLVDSPGSIQIDLATTDVPAGTDVEVVAKPKIGRAPSSQRVTLSPAACTGGTCTAAVAFELDPGGYILEARATFEAP
jgi:hypothetical protein